MKSDTEETTMKIMAALTKITEGTVNDVSLESEVNWESTYRYLLLLQKIGVVQARVKYSFKFDRLKLLQGSGRERTFKEMHEYDKLDMSEFMKKLAGEAKDRRARGEVGDARELENGGLADGNGCAADVKGGAARTTRQSSTKGRENVPAASLHKQKED